MILCSGMLKQLRRHCEIGEKRLINKLATRALADTEGQVWPVKPWLEAALIPEFESSISLSQKFIKVLSLTDCVG